MKRVALVNAGFLCSVSGTKSRCVNRSPIEQDYERQRNNLALNNMWHEKADHEGPAFTIL